MSDPLLSVLDPALSRLILCGGEGLHAAWGPLERDDGMLAVWSGTTGHAFNGYGQIDVPPDRWRLPLDHWRARLALVAAHLIDQESDFAPRIMDLGDGEIGLAVVGGDIVYRCWWAMGTGDMIDHSDGLDRLPDLPTLPAHLRDHDPAVALLLALYDVPEIRARMNP